MVYEIVLPTFTLQETNIAMENGWKLPIYSWFTTIYLWKTVIFHSYVTLPEGVFPLISVKNTII